MRKIKSTDTAKNLYENKLKVLQVLQTQNKEEESKKNY